MGPAPAKVLEAGKIFANARVHERRPCGNRVASSRPADGRVPSGKRIVVRAVGETATVSTWPLGNSKTSTRRRGSVVCVVSARRIIVDRRAARLARASARRRERGRLCASAHDAFLLCHSYKRPRGSRPPTAFPATPRGPARAATAAPQLLSATGVRASAHPTGASRTGFDGASARTSWSRTLADKSSTSRFCASAAVT